MHWQVPGVWRFDFGDEVDLVFPVDPQRFPRA